LNSDAHGGNYKADTTPLLLKTVGRSETAPVRSGSGVPSATPDPRATGGSSHGWVLEAAVDHTRQLPSSIGFMEICGFFTGVHDEKRQAQG